MAIVNHRDIATNGLDEETRRQARPASRSSTSATWRRAAISQRLSWDQRVAAGMNQRTFSFGVTDGRPTSQIAHRCDPDLPRNV